MAKKSATSKGQRLRRDDPDRAAPNRSGSEHIRRNAGPQNGGTGSSKHPNRPVSESLQEAISRMVHVGSDVIEEQIRAGQMAANRLRDGIANSQKLDTDINTLVESLVATTRDVGATWLDLVSIVIRSIGTKPQDPGKPGPKHPAPAPTVTQIGTSGSATTSSSITPADPAIPGVPPQIIVNGVRVRSVVLDLRPHSISFVPIVHQLLGLNSRPAKITAKFDVNRDQAHLVLTVSVAGDQPPGAYTGAVVDSSSNEPGGTVSVTVAG